MSWAYSERGIHDDIGWAGDGNLRRHPRCGAGVAAVPVLVALG